MRLLSVLVSLSILAYVLSSIQPVSYNVLVAKGLKDVVLAAKSGEVKASVAKEFAYRGLLTVTNLGKAKLTYLLKFKVRCLSSEVKYFSLSYRGTLLAVHTNGQSLTGALLELKPGESAELDVEVRLSSNATLGGEYGVTVEVYDDRYPEVTRKSLTLKLVCVDWWDNRFGSRYVIEVEASKSGMVIAEIDSKGYVYLNGRLAGRITPIKGLTPLSLLVVDHSSYPPQLIPFQVEDWEPRKGLGILLPKAILKRDVIGDGGVLVFKFYVKRRARIAVYIGGISNTTFEGDILLQDNTMRNSYTNLSLDSGGFAYGDLVYMNLSGRLVCSWIPHETAFRGRGEWKVALIGPVRALLVYETTNLESLTATLAVAKFYSYTDIVEVDVHPGLREVYTLTLEWVLPELKPLKCSFSNRTEGLACNGVLVEMSVSRGLARMMSGAHVEISNGTLRTVLVRRGYLAGGSTVNPVFYPPVKVVLGSQPLAVVEKVSVRGESFGPG